MSDAELNAEYEVVMEVRHTSSTTIDGDEYDFFIDKYDRTNDDADYVVGYGREWVLEELAKEAARRQ